MSSKVNEVQNKKGRLGRGLNSLLGSNLTSNLGEDFTKRTQAQVPDVAQLQKQTVQNLVESKQASIAVVVGGQDTSKENLIKTQVINKIEVVSAIQNTIAPAPISTPATVVATIPPESRIWKIAVDKLNPNEYQPRQKFNKESLAELAASIKDKGMLQPIVARRHLNGTLEIISGERRWRAAQIAGLHEVPVLIKSVTDQDALELAIIENIQREDLNPIDEAEAYQRLADEFKLTQHQIAAKVCKERATVANAMRLLSLPSLVREMLSQQEITSGHAKVLLSLSDPKTQHQLAKKVLANKLSVRALEKIIQAMQKQPNETIEELDNVEKTKIRLAEAASLELQRLLGTKVVIDYSMGKGKITLAFYSDEEFNQIVEKIKKSWQK